jgi:hypothetical protein
MELTKDNIFEHIVACAKQLDDIRRDNLIIKNSRYGWLVVPDWIKEIIEMTDTNELKRFAVEIALSGQKASANNVTISGEAIVTEAKVILAFLQDAE